MAQRLERCPHCDYLGADVWRSERRIGVKVVYLICRSCGGDWLETEDVPEFDGEARLRLD